MGVDIRVPCLTCRRCLTCRMDGMWCALLVLSWIYTCSAQPVVTVSPSEIVTLANRTITLGCRITGVGNNRVYWSDPGGVIHGKYGLIQEPPFGYVYYYYGYNGPKNDVNPGAASFGAGHSRFSYDFDAQANKYNLRISDVQLADDGVFRCIAPSTNSYSTVFKEVTVTVVVKPPLPEIVGVEPVVTEPAKPDESMRIVTVPFRVTEAKVKCVIGPSKPAFNAIKWYREGEDITDTTPERITIQSPSTTTSNNLFTVTSEITINQPIRDDNNKIFNCLTPIPQGLETVITDGVAVNQSFRLSVQFPPSQPVISGYNTGDIKQPDDFVALECTISGGNPLPSLQWYKNGEPHYHEFKTNEVTSTVKSELLINIQPSDNNAIYRCDAKNAALSEPYTTQVQFKVKFAPKEVTILGGDKVQVGETATLSCTSANSHPQAVLTWFVNGLQIPSSQYSTVVTSSPDGGHVTQSNITVLVNRSSNGLEYTCQGVNPDLGGLVSSSVRLSVLYPPDTLKIQGFNSSIPMMIDVVKKLTCVSTNGNPLPTLKWYNGTAELGAPTVREIKTQGTTRFLDVVVVPQPQDNGASFTCKADGTSMQDTKTLLVQFPPQDVMIIPNNTTLKADQQFQFYCSSGTSNPKSAITWFKNDTEVRQGVTHTEPLPSLYNGWETRSNWTFTPTAADNGLVVLCSARNEVMGRSTTAGVTLNVHHKPIFTATAGDTIALEEGKNATKNLTAVANPPPSEYKWFKLNGDKEEELKLNGKRDGAPSRLSAVDGIFTMTNVQRNQAGKYRVKATNSEGTVHQDFQVNVLYGAKIVGTPTQEYKNGVLELRCVVDANPNVEASNAKWSRPDYDRGKLSIEDSGDNQIIVLNIDDVVRTDLGAFTCEAANEYGSDTKKYTTSPVPFAPEIDKQPNIAKSAAQTHDDGVIKCYVTSYPKPVVTWKKGDKNIDLSEEKYSEKTEEEGNTKFKFELTVTNVGESDYGAYQCSVTNEKGSDSHEILLTGTSRPEPPTDIEVLNVTDSTAILTWVPGFDGGLEQQYRVRYRKSGSSGGYMYADASSTPYTLQGLIPETEYEITVQGINKLGPSDYQTKEVKATTIASATQITPTTIVRDEPIIIIITVLAVVGGLLLIVTAVLIYIFVRRRRHKNHEEIDSASQSNTVELYGTQDDSFHDDAKSYSTYEKGLDEDYSKHYKADDETDTSKKNLFLSKSSAIDTPRKTPSPSQPWSQLEDPYGNYGSYNKQPQASGNVSLEELYANELRNFSRQALAKDGYQRPSFVAGRPPPPPPPGRSSSQQSYPFEIPPSVPDRNYSPVDNYAPYNAGGIHHASYVRSLSSIDSTDDMKGRLV